MLNETPWAPTSLLKLRQTSIVPSNEFKELWSHLGIKADPSKAVFDSKGADGVLASSHKKCAAGMPGAEFLEDYILKDTKNLVWPKGSPKACFLTKNTTTIIGKLKN